MATDSGDATVELLARNVGGDVILGPQRFSRPMAIAELRKQLEQQRQSASGLSGLFRVVLMCEGAELQDGSPLEGQSLECTALFHHATHRPIDHGWYLPSSYQHFHQ